MFSLTSYIFVFGCRISSQMLLMNTTKLVILLFGNSIVNDFDEFKIKVSSLQYSIKHNQRKHVLVYPELSSNLANFSLKVF